MLLKILRKTYGVRGNTSNVFSTFLHLKENDLVKTLVAGKRRVIPSTLRLVRFLTYYHLHRVIFESSFIQIDCSVNDFIRSRSVIYSVTLIQYQFLTEIIFMTQFEICIYLMFHMYYFHCI